MKGKQKQRAPWAIKKHKPLSEEEKKILNERVERIKLEKDERRKELSERAERIKLEKKERRLKQKEEIEFARQIQTIRTRPNRHPLKPWQDPQSLFCDTEFLKKLLKKAPKKGVECKDTPAVGERK